MNDVDPSEHRQGRGADEAVDPLSIRGFAPSDGHSFLLTAGGSYDPHLQLVWTKRHRDNNNNKNNNLNKYLVNKWRLLLTYRGLFQLKNVFFFVD